MRLGFNYTQRRILQLCHWVECIIFSFAKNCDLCKSCSHEPDEFYGSRFGGKIFRWCLRLVAWHRVGIRGQTHTKMKFHSQSLYRQRRFEINSLCNDLIRSYLFLKFAYFDGKFWELLLVHIRSSINPLHHPELNWNHDEMKPSREWKNRKCSASTDFHRFQYISGTFQHIPTFTHHLHLKLHFPPLCIEKLLFFSISNILLIHAGAHLKAHHNLMQLANLQVDMHTSVL